MALVPQDSVVFAASARDNIRFGRPDASDAEIEQAAQLEPFAVLALLIAALAPLLGLVLFWARLPFKILPVTQWSYWFYPSGLLGIHNLL